MSSITTGPPATPAPSKDWAIDSLEEIISFSCVGFIGFTCLCSIAVLGWLNKKSSGQSAHQSDESKPEGSEDHLSTPFPAPQTLWKVSTHRYQRRPISAQSDITSPASSNHALLDPLCEHSPNILCPSAATASPLSPGAAASSSATVIAAAHASAIAVADVNTLTPVGGDTNASLAACAEVATGQCIVCLNAAEEVVLIECGHSGLCVTCASALWTGAPRRQCPLCRSGFAGMMRIVSEHDGVARVEPIQYNHRAASPSLPPASPVHDATNPAPAPAALTIPPAAAAPAWAGETRTHTRALPETNPQAITGRGVESAVGQIVVMVDS